MPSPSRSLGSFGLTSLHFFVFGLMMALGFGTVLAVPTATPPSGAVSPNFSSLNVSGTTTTNDLSATGTLTSTGNISINNDLLETQTINSVDYLTVGYSGTSDTQYAGISRTGKISSIVTNEDYGAYVWNNTTQANKGAIKGRVGTGTWYDGYLGYIDSTGSYGLYTPSNAKILGTLTAAGAAIVNGAISSANGALNLNDDTTVTGALTTTGAVNAGGALSVTGALTTTGAVNAGGALSVTGNSNLQGNVYDSVGALVLNDDVQVGITSPIYPGYVAKLFTGALSALTYATHAEFGNFDIASTDDLFVDDKIFVGNDIIVTDNISAGGNITATGGIGTFYQNYAYGSIGTGWHFINVACETGDIMIACNGRVTPSGARFYGSKFSTYNSRIYCESYGGKDTATSTTSLYAYAYCFSPNGTPTTSTGNQGGTVDSVPLPD